MLIEVVSSLGLMWILRYGSILNVPRSFLCTKFNFLKKLFNCSLCLGFWSGGIIGSFCYYFIDCNKLYLLLPLVSSAVCWFFDSLLDLIQLGCGFFDKNT